MTYLVKVLGPTRRHELRCFTETKNKPGSLSVIEKLQQQFIGPHVYLLSSMKNFTIYNYLTLNCF